MSNIHRLPGAGRSPQEVIQWMEEQVETGDVECIVAGCILSKDSDEETLNWTGSGTRSHIYWLLGALRKSAERLWM